MKKLLSLLFLLHISVFAECVFDGTTLIYETMEEKHQEVPFYKIVDVDYDPEKPCTIYLNDCAITCEKRELCLDLFLKTNPMFR